MSGGTGLTPLPNVNVDDEDVLSAKPEEGFEITPPKEEELPTEPVAEDDITQSEAALRGGASGLTFDMANNIVAAFQSLGSAETFQEKLKKQQTREREVSEKFPKTYYGATAVGGAASLFVPGIGPIARTKQAVAAAKALNAAKQAGNTAAIAVARRTLTKELVAGGVGTGALSGLGASEKESIIDTAADTLTGAVTGAGLSVAVPKVAEKVAEGAKKAGTKTLESFPGLKPIVEGIGDSVETAKGAIKKAWEGERWQVPEFAGRPEKQRRVDEIVKQGQELNLTDRQILNNIAVEFRELPRETLEDIFEQKGIVGTFKRAIAGSQEATEFIDRPEQLRRAEEASKGTTSTMARQAADIGSTEAAISGKQAAKTELSRESQDLTAILSQKRQDLQKQWDTADTATKQRINQELSKLDNQEKQLNAVLAQRKKLIDQYEQSDKDMEQTIKIEIDKAVNTRSEQSMEKLGKIAEDLEQKIKTLAKDRTQIAEDFMDTPASESQLQATYNIKQNLQRVFDENGFGVDGRKALNTAFRGDSRFEKVRQYFRIKDAQNKFDLNQANMDWNKKNGFWDEEKGLVKPGGKPAQPMKPEDRPTLNPENNPSVGELIGALNAARSKVSSAEYGTTLATVKKQVRDTIRFGMKNINEDAYNIHKSLNNTVSKLETLESSPFFETRKIPIEDVINESVATVDARLIKSKIPSGFADVAKKYRSIMRQITQGESMDVADIERMSRLTKEGLPLKPNPRIEQLGREVGKIESRIASLADERQKILDEQTAQLPGLKLQRGEEKRAAIGETVKSKLGIRNRLRQIDDEMIKLNKQLSEQGKRKTQIGETESQLVRTLQETEGIPATARDIGQSAVIGAKGDIPFSIGKIILPSAKQRIETINKVKTRFSNPSLTSAVRVALERPITLDVIRSLAQTHNVPEDQLAQVFGSSVSMSAKPLEMESETSEPAMESQKPAEPDFYQRGIEGVRSPLAKMELTKEYEAIMQDPDKRRRDIKLRTLQDKILSELGSYTE